MVITPRSLSAYHTSSFLLSFCSRYSGQGLVLKGGVMSLQQFKNPSLKFSLLYSLWHKQTSTYAVPHIDVPDILKCLTDALSLPQILSEGMASRLCQLPILCQNTETWNIFGLRGQKNKVYCLFIEQTQYYHFELVYCQLLKKIFTWKLFLLHTLL